MASTMARWEPATSAIFSGSAAGEDSLKMPTSADSMRLLTERMKGFFDHAQAAAPADVQQPGGQRGGKGFEGLADLTDVDQELLADAGIEMPGQHVRVEEIPARPLRHPGADAGPRHDEALGRERLHRLAQHGAGDLEARLQFGVAGQQVALGDLAGDDGAAELVDHVGVAGAWRAPAYGVLEQTHQGTAFPVVKRRRRPGRSAAEAHTRTFCSRMKANSKRPMTILVHQLDRVPSKMM